MNEESKAKELIEKFGDKASDVVDEIIKALPDAETYDIPLTDFKEYWQKVKQIIKGK